MAQPSRATGDLGEAHVMNNKMPEQHSKHSPATPGEKQDWPVSTDFIKHAWLFFVIVLTVCLAAVISWIFNQYH